MIEPSTTRSFGGAGATCPEGKVVLGGGGKITNADGTVSNNYVIQQSGPTENGWQILWDITNNFGNTITARVTAICAIMAP